MEQLDGRTSLLTATGAGPSARAPVTSRTRPQPLDDGTPLADAVPSLGTTFSSAALDHPSTTRFSGPAVRPLTTLR